MSEDKHLQFLRALEDYLSARDRLATIKHTPYQPTPNNIATFRRQRNAAEADVTVAEAELVEALRAVTERTP